MATFTGTRASKIFWPIGGGTVAVAFGSIAITAAPAVNDIYQLCSLPAGAVVIDGKMWATQIDTNASKTLSVGLGWAANGVDAAAPAGLITTSVLTGNIVADVNPAVKSQRNVELASGALPFARDTQIQAQCNAVAATFAAGTLYCQVLYYVP
jgi:hypothetical protein